MGTPEELIPIASEVLAWVANERAPRNDASHARDPDLLRRIELCALATREFSMFHDLYQLPRSGHLCFGDCHHGGDEDADGSEVPQQC